MNTREHLESLAIAKEVGYGSIQAYLTAHGYVPGDKAAAEKELERQSKQVA